MVLDVRLLDREGMRHGAWRSRDLHGNFASYAGLESRDLEPRGDR